MNERIDVLAVIRRHAKSHRAMAETDAYSAQEAPRLEAALDAVAELIEAHKRVRAFLSHEQWGSYHYMEGSEVYDDIRRNIEIIDAALARVGGAA